MKIQKKNRNELEYPNMKENTNKMIIEGIDTSAMEFIVRRKDKSKKQQFVIVKGCIHTKI